MVPHKKTQDPADLHVRKHPVARADRVEPKDASQGDPAGTPKNRHTDGAQYTGTGDKIKHYLHAPPSAGSPPT
jgi:hypothetical protein